MGKKPETDRRQAIVAATFAVLMEKGYAGASTLEIARRARISKRELYAEFGSKAGMLEALIEATSERMQVPLTIAEIRDRASFRASLVEYGTTALQELTSPHVVAVNRLAVAEAGRSPELGKILEASGRESNRRALIALMGKAQQAGVLAPGDANLISGEFFALLIGDLLMRQMLGTARRPAAKDMVRRAERAADAILCLHAP